MGISNQQSQSELPPKDGQPSGEKPTQPDYVTRQDLEQFSAELANKLQSQLDKTYQGMQSLTEKQRTRLNDLDSFLSMMKESGGEVPPDVAARLRTDIMAKSLTEEQSGEQPPKQQTPPAQGGNTEQGVEPDELDIAIQAIIDASGTDIVSDNDPEVSMILDVNKTPRKEFLASVKKAHDAKALRLEKENDPDRAQARSPIIGSQGLPSSNPLQGIMDKDTLWGMIKQQGRV